MTVELSKALTKGKSKSVKPKILVVDIERTAGLARVFQPRTKYVPISSFVRLPALLCFAAKWLGQPKIEFHAAWDDAEAMVQRAHELYSEADAVLGYYSTGFDNGHLRSEWLMAGMAPPSPWKDIDLYKVNRALFGFESKSLNHLCQRLGLQTKSGHYDASMADRCMEGDVKAQSKMRIYNKGDVKITELAYTAMLPWIKTHPHLGRLAFDTELTCNRCQGTDLRRDGTAQANLLLYARYQCQGCGGWVKGERAGRAGATHGI